MKYLNKAQWVGLFKEAGLTDEMMKQWHRVFEKKYPEAHHAFLEHLQIGKDEIERIRKLA